MSYTTLCRKAVVRAAVVIDYESDKDGCLVFHRQKFKYVIEINLNR